MTAVREREGHRLGVLKTHRVEISHVGGRDENQKTSLEEATQTQGRDMTGPCRHGGASQRLGRFYG